MKTQRPVNLNLFTMSYPLPSIVSILHRISGFILFLFIPVLLMVFRNTLVSPEKFESVHTFFTNPLAKFFLWGFLVAYLYHFIAGIRHLLLDINVGVELKSGKLSALITLIIVAILVVLTGIWIW